jgi:hypothetical protein
MYKATLVKEISIQTPNEKGIAAKLSGLVAGHAGVNIRFGWAVGINGSGHFSLMTDDNEKVLEALKNDFPEAKEIDVVLIDTQDAVGELAEITDKIWNADLDIHFIQATYLDNKPVIVVSTNDNQKVLDLWS